MATPFQTPIDPDDVERRLIEIVKAQWDASQPCEITRETRFIEDLDADSLDEIEIIMEAEDEFEITITDEQAEKVRTVGDAVNLVMEIMGQ